MGKNKNKNNFALNENGNENQQEQKREQEDERGNENNQKQEKNDAVILKANFKCECEGCVSTIVKCILRFDGVYDLKYGADQKISVFGKVDPMMLREKLEKKTGKKIEIISPIPKKDKKNDSKENEKSKAKEPPVTTAVLKVQLHCDACIQKICNTVTKTKGCREVKVDKEKDLLTVTGAMDMKNIVQALKKKLKRDVEIVPPKKEKGGAQCSGGDVVEKGGKAGGGENMKWNGLQIWYPCPFAHRHCLTAEQAPYCPYEAGSYPIQLFSDENPHACSVM